MLRRLAPAAVLIAALAAVNATAADDTEAPTGSVTATPAIVAKTPDMQMQIKVAADDHGGDGVASIHLFYAAAGGARHHIRDFDPGKATPDTFSDTMRWDTGLRELPAGRYELIAMLYDLKAHARTVRFGFEIRSASSAPKQKVQLDVTPSVGDGLTLRIRTSPQDVRGKLRVVIERRDGSGDYHDFKKYSHRPDEPWKLEVPLGKGAYRWQVLYDAKAPFVSAKTAVKSFTL